MKRLIILLGVLCLAGCSSSLVILHTNDTHCHYEPMPATGQGGVIERAAFVDSVRKAEGPERVLLLHAGDFSQGSSYFSEIHGDLEPLTINAFGYDVITLGNHEFDNGTAELARRLRMLDPSVKVVCANIDFSPFEYLRDRVTPYAIVFRGGMKIGVIGIEAPLRSNVSAKVSASITQWDNVDVVNRWASYLKRAEKCDMVILLSHIGYREDQELVPHLKKVDLVIGGHSHTFVDDFIYVKDASGKKVPIITDGCWGFEMGCIFASHSRKYER